MSKHLLKHIVLAALLVSAALNCVPAHADVVGSVTPGTRATQSSLSGCTYNSTAPSLTNGQQAAVQCDPSGNQKINSISDASVSTGFQQITSISAATTITPGAGSTYCILTPETQSIRFRTDGTPPTASIGMPVLVGQTVTLRLSSASFANLQVIQTAATASVDVDCYKDS